MKNLPYISTFASFNIGIEVPSKELYITNEVAKLRITRVFVPHAAFVNESYQSSSLGEKSSKVASLRSRIPAFFIYLHGLSHVPREACLIARESCLHIIIMRSTSLHQLLNSYTEYHISSVAKLVPMPLGISASSGRSPTLQQVASCQFLSSCLNLGKHLWESSY